MALVTSSGHRVLDEEVLETVRGWSFRPATQAGVAMKSEVERTFDFRLSDQGA